MGGLRKPKGVVISRDTEADPVGEVTMDRGAKRLRRPLRRSLARNHEEDTLGDLRTLLAAMDCLPGTFGRPFLRLRRDVTTVITNFAPESPFGATATFRRRRPRVKSRFVIAVRTSIRDSHFRI